MSERETKLAEARDHAVPRWTRGREDAALAAITRRRGARGARSAAVIALAVCAAFVAFFVWRLPPTEPAAIGPSASASTSGPRPADESTSTALDPATRMTQRATDAGVEVTLEAGAARFEVTPNRARVFRVLAGDVTVTVLGTIFTVDRREAEVVVTVARGRVGVAWPGGETVLEAGATGSFPPPAAASPTASFAAPPSAARASATAPPRDDTGDLLRDADAARVAGKPGDAEAALRKVTSQHGGDPRAPLAAFALGRLYLEQLGRPRDAARAFATARRGGGALGEDALAREVEAWARAGEAANARAKAEEYARLFPTSPRLAAVKKLGGVGDSD